MTARSPLALPPTLAPLIDQPRWVVWKWVTGKDGKRTKPPFRGREPRKHASSIDAATWCDFNTAMRAYCDLIGPNGVVKPKEGSPAAFFHFLASLLRAMHFNCSL